MGMEHCQGGSSVWAGSTVREDPLDGKGSSGDKAGKDPVDSGWGHPVGTPRQKPAPVSLAEASRETRQMPGVLLVTTVGELVRNGESPSGSQKPSLCPPARHLGSRRHADPGGGGGGRGGLGSSSAVRL